jgi:hypothetical protein
MTVLEAYSRLNHNYELLDGPCRPEVILSDGRKVDGSAALMIAGVSLAGDLATAETDEDLLSSYRRFAGYLYGASYNDDDVKAEVDWVLAMLTERYGVDLGAEYGAG